MKTKQIVEILLSAEGLERLLSAANLTTLGQAADKECALEMIEALGRLSDRLKLSPMAPATTCEGTCGRTYVGRDAWGLRTCGEEPCPIVLDSCQSCGAACVAGTCEICHLKENGGRP